MAKLPLEPEEPGPTVLRLVLASTSRYRRQLIERLHIPFDAVDPGLDEDPYKRLGLTPTELVLRLAEAKARAVADQAPNALIIGGDQVAAIDDQILGKPSTVEESVKQLGRLAGRTHRLVTAICVLESGSGRTGSVVDVHEMTMRPLTEKQIAEYVQVDLPLDCAGSYKLESLGVALFESIAGDDPTAIIGVPMMLLVSLLQTFGYDVFANARARNTPS